MSKKVFSYCIYGDNIKYCLGLIKNLEQVKEYFPDFEVFIAVGNDVPIFYVNIYKSFNNVTITNYNYSGNHLMVYRYYPIDHTDVDTVIIRDADSRFTKRDLYYINKFLNQDVYKIYTIRDHHYHTTPIMGGQWGIKNIQSLKKIRIQEKYEQEYFEKADKYGNDQKFLIELLYNNSTYFKLFIAYTHKYVYNNCQNTQEKYELMELPRENEYDFCGNVTLFDSKMNEYNEFKFVY